MLTFRLMHADGQSRGYCLRVPVTTLGKSPITGLEATVAFDAAGLRVALTQEERLLVVTACGFASSDAAAEWLPRVISGLWALALRFNVAFKGDLLVRPVTRPSDPVASAAHIQKSMGLDSGGPIHGVIEADSATTYAADDTLLLVGLGQVSAHVSTNVSQAVPILKRGIESDVAPQAVADESMRTAMDLYVSHFYEVSTQARLLSLVMVLEVLAPRSSRHSVSRAMVAEWRTQLSNAISSEEDQEAREALEALRSELGFKTETSIQRRILHLVRSTITEPELAATLVRDVKIVYTARSDLAHKGTLDSESLGSAYTKALFLVQRVLAAKLAIPDLFASAAGAA